MFITSTTNAATLRWVTKAQFSTRPNWASFDYSFSLSTFA
jgi:hypothetical protein